MNYIFKKMHLLKNVIDSNNKKKNCKKNSKIPSAKKKQEFHV